MEDKFEIARNVVFNFLETKKSFTLEELQDEILKNGGILQVSTQQTLTDFLDFYEEAGFIKYKPTTKTYYVIDMLKYYMNLPYILKIRIIDNEYSVSIPLLGEHAFVGQGSTFGDALTRLEITKQYLFEEYIKKGMRIPNPKFVIESFIYLVLLYGINENIEEPLYLGHIFSKNIFEIVDRANVIYNNFLKKNNINSTKGLILELKEVGNEGRF